MKRTRSNQPAVDKTIADDLAATSAQVVQAASKPELVDQLRATWRKSAEHKAAQVKLFVSSLAGIVVLQVVSDLAAGKTPFSTVHDTRSLWFYLAPFVLVAWRQLHPALTASQVDSAPGATIVPTQVGVPDPDPAPEGDAAP
jgi:hypothetical protein